VFGSRAQVPVAEGVHHAIGTFWQLDNGNCVWFSQAPEQGKGNLTGCEY
jgi:hypothetical protein